MSNYGYAHNAIMGIKANHTIQIHLPNIIILSHPNATVKCIMFDRLIIYFLFMHFTCLYIAKNIIASDCHIFESQGAVKYLYTLTSVFFLLMLLNIMYI